MFLALREFKHAKLRYALVTGVIVMVASLVFILSGLANGLSSGNSEAISAIDADGLALTSGSEYLLDRSRLSQETVDAVSSADGVEEAEPFSAAATSARLGDGDDVLGLSIIGVNPDSFMDPGAKTGDSLSDNPEGIVMDQSMADDGVKVGDSVVFENTGVELQVIGVTDGHQYRLVPTAFVSLDTYQKLFPDAQGTYGAIALRGDKDAIEALPDSVDGIMIGSKTDLIENLPGYQEQRGTLLMIQGFLVVIAAGIIAAFFFILTLQKMPELGVMKALGSTTATLAGALVTQALVLGLIGILIGIGAGLLMQTIVAGTVPYQVDLRQMVLFGVVLLIVAVAGTLLSLIRIARVDPLDAINKPA